MREFVISNGNVTVANALVTLVWVNPPAAPNVNLEFLRYWVGQAANATSAQQPIAIATQATSFPTVVSASATPQKLKPADPNASVIVASTSGLASTCGTNASAESTGTKTVVWDDCFNVLNGWLHVPTPPETRVMPAGLTSGQSLYFISAPATLGGWSFGTVYREV